MSTAIFDSHCHPQFIAYDQDREEMLRRNIAEGVLMIAVGTMYESSKNGVELAKKYPKNIWAAVGIHPYHVTKNLVDPMETTEESRNEKLDSRSSELAGMPEVVAIGESGLDYYYLEKHPPEMHAEIIAKQRENFLEHIALAKRFKKPLIIHARRAYSDIRDIMHEAKFPYGAVMHFFQGTPEEAKWFLDLGFYISFAGPITFAKSYEEVVKFVPLEHTLIETDAPYATPAPHRGKRNEPIYVRYVAQKVAELKGLTTEVVVEKTVANTRNLFHI